MRSLRLTFLTHLLDSEVYVESGDTGYGIFEIDAERTAEQRREFMPIVRWVDQDSAALPESSATIIQLSRSRAS